MRLPIVVGVLGAIGSALALLGTVYPDDNPISIALLFTLIWLLVLLDWYKMKSWEVGVHHTIKQMREELEKTQKELGGEKG